ncbi:MAG: LicD family protein [Lachnospiraceae bacterium]|nr:LicD family protein [Lachnospiraceae bacterium]
MQDLKEIHALNKKMLVKFHNICEKNGISYEIAYGTLLGSVRHKSFIPWDDDVDIFMTREEYYKLKNIPQEEWGEELKLVDYKDIIPNRFFDFVPKVVLLNQRLSTVAIDRFGKNDSEYIDLLALDIFIIDKAYKSKLLQMIKYYRLLMIYGQAIGHRPSIDFSSYSTMQKMVIKICSTIGKRRKLSKIFAAYDTLSQKSEKNSDRVFIGNTIPKYLGHTFKREWFNVVCDYRIDENVFCGPENYDEVLKEVYGEYMTPPSQDERKPHHLQ